ncbi:Fructose-1,6-bisphosphatase class II [Pseudovibrio sp. FO-BEG1]|uniref:Fructose-1,6-bisphosphatase n=3 Tax=Pseudovibrio TaxID=258255 RepID=A0A1I7BR53_9HYPH|nr:MULTISPECIES: class II fructose-bisphosphatase [Pseudovibrio]AEV38036.1 Fructose-1,6-bisphosphatase class II [Pseudovibrio sp. FO-BEG1]EEA96796.1 fructose-1,6-bisphosphatase, class II [Pseudovibrio sp. JE062]QUS54218.1 class II fructose-bisphosphatase [Pseudovibrio brasiliensis]SFK71433.1 fructose-1,6-bisphosphatase II / sedoheptulose-1,7-bisphosphatase [Pseudovibrio ascidiaceicola]SFT89583.1 fructose-1,6-bisphosphatase II / sedoheptulose-1,7-bisphosphatase [Pseudovibrio denitrificans]
MADSHQDATDVLDRILTLELARVTERAAVSAARLRGRGDEKAADQAAVDAMRRELNQLPIDGTVVIGEGERDEAPMLYIGEKVGTKDGPKVDIALDPLEGTTICAKNMPNSIAVIALAPEGGLLNAPDSYMDKIAIGPGYPEGTIDLDRPIQENLAAVAKAKGCDVKDVTVCVLDRPRHAKLIDDIRATGASIYLIGDGDVAGIIYTTDPEETGIDLYVGIGGAPEGVLAAAALRCIGGQMQGRLVITREEQVERAGRMGIDDINRKYTMEEMAGGDVLFAATGVTTGNFLKGVKLGRDNITTHTVVMRSTTGTVRFIEAKHTQLEKFHLD